VNDIFMLRKANSEPEKKMEKVLTNKAGPAERKKMRSGSQDTKERMEMSGGFVIHKQ
jgi:hypothetical protein